MSETRVNPERDLGTHLEVVDGLEGVDARDPSVLEPEDDAFVVLARVSEVLPDQNEIRAERPEKHHVILKKTIENSLNRKLDYE